MSGIRARIVLSALVLVSALPSASAIAQAPACPIEGLGRYLTPGCARVDEVHDPAGHLHASAGDTPSDGICLRPFEARSLEQGVCGGVRSRMLTVRDGFVVVPFSLMRAAGYGRLREGINVTDEGTVLMRVDPTTNRFIIRANGKYARATHPQERKAFRANLSMAMRPRPAAAAPGATSSASYSELMASPRVEGFHDAGAPDAGLEADAGL